MNTLARREGFRWLVTTSRRTGAEAEARLRAGLDASFVAAAVWWAEKPEKKMAAFLGAAECVIVTQDSVTMVTEAVSSGRPVAVASPTVVRFPKRSFMPGYLATLEQAGRIVRTPMVDLAATAIAMDRLSVRRAPVELKMLDCLIERLAWHVRHH
jgi:mitochondrial fission protein ELM1